MNKIPVIGTPVVNSSFWVTRLLMSVDYPVETFVIINNNGKGELNEDLNRLVQMDHKYIDEIKVVHMPANIGCAGAWNLIIKCYMNAPYWIISNDDVAFKPGLLKNMAEHIDADPVLGMIHPNKGDFELGAWDLFLIRDIIVQEFGLFDENTYPAYCEDADYMMRLAHRPIRKLVGLEPGYLHGEGDSSDYYNSGSQTKKTDPTLETKLNFANNLNIEYLTSKWGEGWRLVQPSENPFGDRPVNTTTYDLNFVRSKHLGF